MVNLAALLMPVSLVLTLGVLACWLMLDRRHAWYLLLGVAIAAAFLLSGYLSLDVNNRDIVVLQAGLSQLSISHVFGLGNHFCTTCAAYTELMAGLGSHRLPIQDMVLANRILTAVNVAGFGVLAMKVTRSWLYSFLYVAVTFLLPVVQISADSNYSSTGLTTLMLVIVLCAAVFGERSRLGFLAVVLSMPTAAAATVLAGLTRPEMLVPGCVAIGLMLVRISPLDRVISRVTARIGGLLRARDCAGKPDWKARLRGLVVTVAAASCTIAVITGICAVLRSTAIPVWAVDGLDPLHRTWYTAPRDIFKIIPAPLVLMVLMGIGRILLNPILFLGLPVSLIILTKTAASATHVEIELHTIFRMFAPLTPLLMVAGLWGVRDLHRWFAGRMGPFWTRLLLSGLMAGSLLMVPRYTTDFLSDPPTYEALSAGLAGPDSMLNKNLQMEVRGLAKALDSHPDCLFLTKAFPHSSYSSIRARRWPVELTDFWFTRSGNVSMNPPESVPECVLFYRSLDCNIIGARGCESIMKGAKPVWEASFPGRPYGDYIHETYNEPIVLGLYVLPRDP